MGKEFFTKSYGTGSKRNSLKIENKYTWGKKGSIYGANLFNK